jgi:hypothetical protein
LTSAWLAHGCGALAPAWLCAHGDMLLYLAPSLALAFLIWIFSSAHPFFFIFTVAGTFFHELAHFGAGLLTGAEPSNFTVIPRRAGRTWELGSVTFQNLRWYNAAPSALAPFFVLLVPLAVAAWRTSHPGWHFRPVDLALAWLLAPQFLSFWPSDTDWRLAARSWPWLLVAAGGLLFHYRDFLLQLVKS